MKIELYDRLVKIKHDDGGYSTSNKITDFLLAKIIQLLEKKCKRKNN